MSAAAASTPRWVLRLAPGVEMAFRQIPAGAFRMGSRGEGWADEEPRHVVVIPVAFWLGETPVTQEQFAAWPGHAAGGHENYFAGRPTNPAESVPWFEAVAFCDWLTREHGRSLPSDAKLACLPTEAEWEYGCRAGTETEYHTGDGAAALVEAGWFADNAGASTQPVGGKVPNAFGLFDMHGNVWEWCHHAWEGYAYRTRSEGERDPGCVERLSGDRGHGPARGDSRRRVLRGGSWFDSSFRCRSAFRDRNWPSDRSRIFGFRVCLVRSPVSAGGVKEQVKLEPARRDGAARDERAESSCAGGGVRFSVGPSRGGADENG